jgi:hypothetical protein
VRRASFLSLFLAIQLNVFAQQASPAAKPRAAKSAAAHEDAAIAAQLPVTRVSLYKNGVGFFEHDGRVTGDQPVTINFTTDQLNDVLQSLTAVDLGGGRITGAGYNSTTPLEQQLKALPLALDENANAVDFYNAIRGARVEVRSGAVSITGRLLNIEVVNQPASGSQPESEKRMITVVGDAGEVRTVELTPATEVHLLDAALNQDVTRYLQLLAGTRNQGLRHLTLQDNGTGTRELHVSYISEVPIWKSTYRILFTDGLQFNGKVPPTPIQSATLQGWSVVDNTTGADWVNVQLSLIAGAPQSFIQPLSVPYYSRRPEISLPQEAMLTPQTHESGEETAEAVPVAAGVAGIPAMAMGSGSGSGMAAGVGGSFGGNVLKVDDGAAFGGSGQINLNQAYVDSFAANAATTAAFDDYFAYNLTDPVTIRKNESALVPILQTKVDAERVTLWSRQEPTPLRALWVTNTSNLTLDRGSFTIVEDGNFGGEGLLDPIHPAEKRLLSYAVDQAVRVTTESQNNSSRVTSITASKGVLVVRNKQVAEVTYVVHNAATEARTVIVEHPVRSGYTLNGSAADGTPAPKPVETTPAAYRFRVVTQPGATERLHVGETLEGAVSYQLTNSDDTTLTFILNQTNDNPALKAALQPVLDARRREADMQEALNNMNTRLSALRSDEERQRANVTALASADRASRERFVHDLNATEDQIAAAQKELATAEANLQAAKDDLAGRIENLQVDEKL